MGFRFHFHFSLCLLLASSIAGAQNLKTGLKINPALAMKTLESHTASDGKTFTWRGEGGGVEVAIKGTTLPSEKEAEDLARVEYMNVMHLYAERGNPYQGQISQLVVCDSKFKPKEEKLNLFGKAWPALQAGANSRKGFGACNKDQVSNWAEYFNFTDSLRTTMISVRLFTAVNAADSKSIEGARQRLHKMAAQLIVKDET
jgi:hypothetical protein